MCGTQQDAEEEEGEDEEEEAEEGEQKGEGWMGWLQYADACLRTSLLCRLPHRGLARGARCKCRAVTPGVHGHCLHAYLTHVCDSKRHVNK